MSHFQLGLYDGYVAGIEIAWQPPQLGLSLGDVESGCRSAAAKFTQGSAGIDPSVLVLEAVSAAVSASYPDTGGFAYPVDQALALAADRAVLCAPDDNQVRNFGNMLILPVGGSYPVHVTWLFGSEKSPNAPEGTPGQYATLAPQVFIAPKQGDAIAGPVSSCAVDGVERKQDQIRHVYCNVQYPG